MNSKGMKEKMIDTEENNVNEIEESEVSKRETKKTST